MGCRILALDVGSPGSWHDARCFKESGIQDLFEDAIQGLDCFVVGGVIVPPQLLVDSAYAGSPTIMKPFQQEEQTTEKKRRYNVRHCRSRMVVEGAIGQGKGKFRMLRDRSCIRDLAVHSKLIAAGAILHNMHVADARPATLDTTLEREAKWQRRCGDLANAGPYGPAIKPHLESHNVVRDVQVEFLHARAGIDEVDEPRLQEENQYAEGMQPAVPPPDADLGESEDSWVIGSPANPADWEFFY